MKRATAQLSLVDANTCPMCRQPIKKGRRRVCATCKKPILKRHKFYFDESAVKHKDCDNPTAAAAVETTPGGTT